MALDLAVDFFFGHLTKMTDNKRIGAHQNLKHLYIKVHCLVSQETKHKLSYTSAAPFLGIFPNN